MSSSNRHNMSEAFRPLKHILGIFTIVVSYMHHPCLPPLPWPGEKQVISYAVCVIFSTFDITGLNYYM